MFGDKEARILVLGLDNAGKTTILCKLMFETISDHLSYLCVCQSGEVGTICLARCGIEVMSFRSRVCTPRCSRRQAASGGGSVDNTQ